jgi:hypothetical protein
MKATRTAIAMGTLVAAAAVALAPPATAATGPLAGTWTSLDTDGSNQTLEIVGTGAHVYAVTYFDDEASSACGGDPARIVGPGFTDGDTITLVGALTCLPGGNHFRTRFTIAYSYDGSTDTLTDDFGVTWDRAG